MAVRFLAPESRTAAISASGMPHSPKPPTANTCPSLITPSSAALALGKTLFTRHPSLFLPACRRAAWPRAAWAAIQTEVDGCPSQCDGLLGCSVLSADRLSRRQDAH